MADKFRNLPGMPVNIVDGNLVPDSTPAGPVVAVLGTGVKGPAKVESTVLGGAAAVTKYGSSGSLGRGLAEAFQGGSPAAIGFRILTTKGKLEHIGDDSGAAGISVETVAEGADALEKFSILYDQVADRLKIYDENGVLVYDKTGDVVAVNAGVVTVTGSAVNDESTENQVFGSIGKQLPVCDSEALQTATLDVGTNKILTLTPGLSGLNLGKLGFVNSTATPIMAQLRSQDQTVLVEELVSSVDVANGTVTLAAAIDSDYYDNDADTGLHGDASAPHDVRFISMSRAVRMDQAINNRLPAVGSASPELLATPGSNFNGLAKLANAAGLRKDSTLAEVEPHKMNLYEALLDAALALEAAPFDVLVMMDAYADDPALDGQTEGETKLPTTEAEGLLFDSAVNGDAGIGGVTAVTLSSLADRALLRFATEAERTSAIAKLAAAGRGSSWMTISTPQDEAFGDNLERDELVRSGRILNWEKTSLESFTVVCKADAEGSLNDKFWTFSDGDTSFYVWYNVNDGGTDPEEAGTGIEVAVATDAAAAVVAAATKKALAESAANVLASVSNATVTVELVSDSNATDAADGAGGDATGFTITVSDDHTDLLVHFDRDLSFSVDSVTGLVVGAKSPDFKVFNTPLMFFHRSKDVDGTLLHMWYTSKADPEGNAYNEVNFAYRLGAICHEMTENETAVIGSIGVRPPANHFNPADISRWIGVSPVYDDEGDVSLNGRGLLGNKFMAGMGLNGSYNDASQFDPGFKATASGQLDDSKVLLDSNGFEIDLGKYISIVPSWPVLSNASDTTGLGYIGSAAALYAGMMNGIAPWRGTTAKRIGGNSIRLPVRIAKRHLNSLTGARYVMLTGDTGVVSVVDGPTAALPSSDYTRNMTVRLVSEAVRRIRRVGRPFLGDALSAVRKAGLETLLKKELSDLQNISEGALEGFDLAVTQSPLDKRLGTAKVTLALKVINELRKLTVDVALTQ